MANSFEIDVLGNNIFKFFLRYEANFLQFFLFCLLSCAFCILFLGMFLKEDDIVVFFCFNFLNCISGLVLLCFFTSNKKLN